MKHHFTQRLTALLLALAIFLSGATGLISMIAVYAQEQAAEQVTDQETEPATEQANGQGTDPTSQQLTDQETEPTTEQTEAQPEASPEEISEETETPTEQPTEEKTEQPVEEETEETPTQSADTSKLSSENAMTQSPLQAAAEEDDNAVNPEVERIRALIAQKSSEPQIIPSNGEVIEGEGYKLNIIDGYMRIGGWDSEYNNHKQFWMKDCEYDYTIEATIDKSVDDVVIHEFTRSGGDKGIVNESNAYVRHALTFSTTAPIKVRFRIHQKIHPWVNEIHSDDMSFGEMKIQASDYEVISAEPTRPLSNDVEFSIIDNLSVHGIVKWVAKNLEYGEFAYILDTQELSFGVPPNYSLITGRVRKNTNEYSPLTDSQGQNYDQGQLHYCGSDYDCKSMYYRGTSGVQMDVNSTAHIWDWVWDWRLIPYKKLVKHERSKASDVIYGSAPIVSEQSSKLYPEDTIVNKTTTSIIPCPHVANLYQFEVVTPDGRSVMDRNTYMISGEVLGGYEDDWHHAHDAPIECEHIREGRNNELYIPPTARNVKLTLFKFDSDVMDWRPVHILEGDTVNGSDHVQTGKIVIPYNLNPPTFDKPEGTYNQDITVKLERGDFNPYSTLIIYKINDGQERVYEKPLELKLPTTSRTENTYKITAWEETDRGESRSVEVTQTYTLFNDNLRPPTADKESGTYTKDISVALSSNSANPKGTQICYILDNGQTQTYSEPVTLKVPEENQKTSTHTITAWTQCDGKQSDKVTYTYKMYNDNLYAPSADKQSGTYYEDISVSLLDSSDNPKGTQIRYTLNDGSTSTYSSPITLRVPMDYQQVSTTKITAWAEYNGVKSDKQTFTYGLMQPHRHHWAYLADGSTLLAYCDQALRAGEPACSFGENTKTLTATLSADENIVYDGSAHGAEVTYSEPWQSNGIPTLTIQYAKKDAPDKKSTKAPWAVGTYIASITAGNATATLEYTISKADGMVVAEGQKEWIYDGKDHNLKLNVSAPGSLTGLIFSFSDDNGVTWKDKAPVYQDVSTHNVKWKVESDNYATKEGTAELKITPATLTYVRESIKGKGKTYDGTRTAEVDLHDIQVLGSVQDTDFRKEHLAIKTSNELFADEGPGPAIYISFDAALTTDDDKFNNYKNYQLEEHFLKSTTYATIFSALLTPHFDKTEWTYGSAEEAEVTYTADGELSYGDPGFYWTYKGVDGTSYEESTTHPTQPGNYMITAKIKNRSYKLAEPVTHSYVIHPKPITISAKDVSKIYGDADSVDQITTDYNGKENLVDKDTLALTYTREEGETVTQEDLKTPARYPITLTTASGADNWKYIITILPGGALTITPRPLTIKGMTAADKTYDGTTEAKIDTHFPVFDNLAQRDSGKNLEVGAYGMFENSQVGENKNVNFYGVQLMDLNVNKDSKPLDYLLTPNYKITVPPAKAAIKDKSERHPLDVTIQVTGKEYDGTSITAATYSVDETQLVAGHPAPTFRLYYRNITTGQIVMDPPKDVGEYEVVLWHDPSDNFYDINCTGAAFKITPRPAKVTAADKTKIYGDPDPVLTATETNVVTGETLNYTITRSAGNDVGEYTITPAAKQGANPNYSVTFVEAKLTIQQLPVSAEGIGARDKVYDGTTAAQLDKEQLHFYRTSDETKALPLPYGDKLSLNADAEFEDKNVGEGKTVDLSNYVLVSGLADRDCTKNYSFNLTSLPKTVTAAITPKPITAKIIVNDGIYGQNRASTATLTGLITPDNPNVTLTYYDMKDIKEGETVKAYIERKSGEAMSEYPKDAGAYIVVVTQDDQNYQLLPEPAYSDYIVTPLPVTLQADNKNIVYGDADAPLTFTKVEGDVPMGVELGEFIDIHREPGNDAGVYTISLAVKPDQPKAANYKFTFIDGLYTIEQKPLKVTGIGAQDKIYDGTLDVKLDLTKVSFDGLLDKDAGKIDISVTGQFTDKNVKSLGYPEQLLGEEQPVQVDLSEIALVGDDAESEILAKNYVLTPGKQQTETQATILRRPYTAVIHVLSGVYGEPIAPATVEIGNVVEGETLPVALHYTGKTRAQADYDRDTMPDQAGTYQATAVQQPVNNNYCSDAVQPVDFNIDPRPLTLLADASDKIYGEQDPELTWQIIQGSLVRGDTLNVNIARDPGENAGTYPIVISENEGANPNYTFIFKENEFTIFSRPVTLTADDKTKVYGTVDEELTYQVTEGNVVEGDTLNVSLERDPGEDADSYRIRISQEAEANPNYRLTFVNGTYSITKAPIVIDGIRAENKRYDGTTDATLVFDSVIFHGLVGDDQLDVTATGRFEDPNVGKDKTVNLRNLRLLEKEGWDDLKNYLLAPEGQQETTTADIFIDPKDELTITWQKGGGIYGGIITPAEPTVTDKDGNTFTDYTLVYVGGSYEESEKMPDQAGRYKAKINLNGDDSGMIIHGDMAIDFIVSPRPAKLRAVDRHVTYGEAEAELAWNEVQTEEPDTGIVGGDTLTGISVKRKAGKNVGTYPITLKQLLGANPNYTITLEAGTYTIEPRALTLKADDKTKIYGAVDEALTYKVTAGNVVDDDVPAVNIERAAGENVGSYAISISQNEGANPNYSLTFVDGAYNITKAPIVIDGIRAENKLYDETTDATLVFDSVIFHGLVGDDQLDVTATGEFEDPDVGVDKTVNLRNLELLEKEGRDDLKNYELAPEGQQTTTLADIYEIPPIELNVQWNECGGIYGGTITPAEPTVTDGDGNPFTAYTVVYVGGNYPESTTVPDQAGRYKAKMVLDQGVKAIIHGDMAIDFIVSPRPATLKADNKDKVYGEVDAELTWKEVESEAADSGIVRGDTLTGISAKRTSGKDVGAYTITLKQLLGANPNYTITLLEGVYTISPRPLSVTADNKEKIYGEADKALTYTVTTGSLVGDDTLNVKLERAAGENVGDYGITLSQDSGANPNYRLSFNNGTYSIIGRPVTLTADDKTKVYGSSDEALTYSISEGKLIGTDTLKVKLERVLGEDVGSYEIFLSQDPGANPNYSLTFESGNYAITPRSLSVTADNKEKIYGEADETLTYTFTEGSLMDGDSLNVMIDRELGEDVGIYTIFIGGNESDNPNYSITYIPGEYKISPRFLTLKADDKTKVYGKTDEALTYTPTAGSLVGSDKLQVDLERAAGEDVGSYAISISQNEGANPNYSLTFVEGTYSITRAPIVIDGIRAENKRYDGTTDATLVFDSVIFHGLVGDDQLDVTATGAFRDPAVGDNKIVDLSNLTLKNKQDRDDLKNYELAPEGQQETTLADIYDIPPIDLYVNWNECGGIYGGTITPAEPTVTDKDDNPFTDYTVVYVGGDYPESENVPDQAGRYKAKMVLDKGVKAIIHGDMAIDFIVRPRPATLKAVHKEVTYGDAEAKLTWVEFKTGAHDTGIVPGDTLTGISAKRASGKDVGDYTITLKQLLGANPNYTITLEGDTYTITQRPVTVDRIRAKNKKYDGKTDAELILNDMRINGIVKGDELSINKNLVIGTFIDENVGIDKTVYIRGLALTDTEDSSNYVLDIENSQKETKASIIAHEVIDLGVDLTPNGGFYGTLILPTARLQILDTMETQEQPQNGLKKAKLLRDAAPDGAQPVPDYDLTYTDDLGRSVSPKSAGEYTVMVDVDPSQNPYAYNLIGQTMKTYKIYPRPVVVSADNKEQIYGDPETKLTWSLAEGSTMAYEEPKERLGGFLLKRQQKENEGKNPDVDDYSISITRYLGANPNYMVTCKEGTYSVTPRPIIVAAKNVQKTVGQADPKLDYTVTGLVLGDQLEGIKVTRTKGEDPGSYPIKVSQESDELNSNYEISFVPGTLTIVAKDDPEDSDADAGAVATGIIKDNRMIPMAFGFILLAILGLGLLIIWKRKKENP